MATINIKRNEVPIRENRLGAIGDLNEKALELPRRPSCFR